MGKTIGGFVTVEQRRQTIRCNTRAFTAGARSRYCLGRLKFLTPENGSAVIRPLWRAGRIAAISDFREFRSGIWHCLAVGLTTDFLAPRGTL
jgi:hypothetical protein